MIWLIICTLGYGSVWAFDGHLHEGEEHQRVTGDVSHAADEDGDHPSCDHCCHASAHLMALWSAQPGTAYTGAGSGYTPYRQLLSFHTTSPPERPPQG
ncbi:MAG: hypothetical protein U9P11_10825 [Pseudomonadota bacterium]|nr:hypothetical protein [Pseudomonadota bacterium]